MAVRHFHTQFQEPGSLPVAGSGQGLSASGPIENVTAPAENCQLNINTYDRDNNKKNYKENACGVCSDAHIVMLVKKNRYIASNCLRDNCKL